MITLIYDSVKNLELKLSQYGVTSFSPPFDRKLEARDVLPPVKFIEITFAVPYLLN